MATTKKAAPAAEAKAPRARSSTKKAPTEAATTTPAADAATATIAAPSEDAPAAVSGVTRLKAWPKSVKPEDQD